ncbi:MAG: c-type cytochrome [Solirubrobacterales bacterium]
MKRLHIASWLFTVASAVYMFFSSPPSADEAPEIERHKRRIRLLKLTGAVVFIAIAGAVATTAAYLMFSGPRMWTEPKYVPYQAQLPPTPEGVVAVSPASAAVPSENPLPRTEATLASGRIYYGYYCAFCHGGAGQVTGPVGRSYMPAPTPLALPRIQAMSDSQLYRAMLTGVGHEPVLEYVIDVQTRWYIVSYVRTLGSERP